MSTSHFSGKVDSVAGFSVNGTEVINSSAQIANTQTALTVTTLTAPTVNSTNVDAGASGTAGTVDVFPATAANGKLIVSATNAGGAFNTTVTNSTMGQSSVISIPDPGTATSKFVLQDGTNTTATITTITATTVNATTVDATTLEINNVAVGSTAAEIDRQCDISLQTETIAEGGVVSVTKRVTKIVSTGAGADTIAAPDASSLGQVKVIEMTGGEHDVTLALTNVQGGSAATTATFSDINDTLVLVAGTLKWNVVSEAGVVLS